jgi:gamma-glutamyltranspeptidase
MSRLYPCEAAIDLNGEPRKAMADQIATVSKLRLKSKAGTLSRQDVQATVIVLGDKLPVLASAAIGSALQEVTLQNLINVLHLGLDPQTAVNQPNFLGPFVGINATGASQPQMTKEVLDRGFSDLVIRGLKKRGQDIYEGRDAAVSSGYWIGIQIDPKSKALSGGATRRLNSFIEGY